MTSNRVFQEGNMYLHRSVFGYTRVSQLFYLGVYKKLTSQGVEPWTFALLARRSNQLS